MCMFVLQRYTALQREPLHCVKIDEIGNTPSDFESVSITCAIDLPGNIS